MSIKLKYLRDRNNNPIACVASNVIWKDKVIKYQYSIYNPKDPFSKDIARQVAIGRLIKQPLVTNLPEMVNAHDITQLILKNMLDINMVPNEDCSETVYENIKPRFPKRVIRAINDWLEEYEFYLDEVNLLDIQYDCGGNCQGCHCNR